eukprot:Awhi_evm1s12291
MFIYALVCLVAKFRITWVKNPLWALTIEDGASPADGVRLILGTDTTSPWSYDFAARRLEYASSGYCLYSDEADEQNIKLWSCDDNINGQKWNINHVGKVQMYNSNLCIDNIAGQQIEGNDLQLYACVEDDENQQWKTGFRENICLYSFQ